MRGDVTFTTRFRWRRNHEIEVFAESVKIGIDLTDAGTSPEDERAVRLVIKKFNVNAARELKIWGYYLGVLIKI